MGKTKQDYENEIVAKGITLGTTAAKLEASLISKTDNKAALDLRGVSPSDILREYPDRIAAIKAWQELASFGIPQSEIDLKNSKWADGVAYANELLRDYPDGNIPDGVLDKDRLVVYPFSEIPSKTIEDDYFRSSGLEYVKDNILNWNALNSQIQYAFQGCTLGNITLNINNVGKDNPLAFNQTFQSCTFGIATINLTGNIPATRSTGFTTMFGGSKGSELTLNAASFSTEGPKYAFSGTDFKKLTINLTNSNGVLKDTRGMFVYSSIKELNITANTPFVFEGDNELFLHANSLIETIPFDIVASNKASLRSFFSRCKSLKSIEIFDARDIGHLSSATIDGYYTLAAFQLCGVLTSGKLKISEGIDLSPSPLNNTSIDYLINNLSYPSHSDYEKNGGTLRPTIKLHPTSYAYFISQQNLVDHATTLGYDIIQ